MYVLCVCILSIVLDISACVCPCCVTLWSADIHVSTYLAYMYQKYVCVHVLCFSVCAYKRMPAVQNTR